jgi:hypothetical protein
MAMCSSPGPDHRRRFLSSGQIFTGRQLDRCRSAGCGARLSHRHASARWTGVGRRWCRCWGALATAQVFDSARRGWIATGSLAAPRRFHIATLLPNGKVLVAGGYYSTTLVITFSPAAEPLRFRQRRLEHYRPLLPARAMITPPRCCPTARCSSSGAMTASPFSPARSYYDPASGAWSCTGCPRNSAQVSIQPRCCPMARCSSRGCQTTGWRHSRQRGAL